MTAVSSHEVRAADAFERLVPWVIPVALAVLTWLTVLLAAGVVLRMQSLSIQNFIPLFFVGLLFWPIYHLEPWREGVTARTRRWASRRPAVIPVAIGLAILPVVPFVPDVVISLLQLPYRGSGIFFGASLFYRQRFGPVAGQLILRFGQWYFELLWLSLLATGLLGVINRFR